jgi:hypothetical protein
VQEHLARIERRAAEHRFLDGHRLLENFLEHEVLVPGLLGHDRIPGHPRALLRHRAPRVIGELDPAARDDGHLLIAEEHDVARVRKNGRNIGGNEELALTEADDDRRPVAYRHDLVGIVRRDQHEREQSAHVEQRTPDRVLEPVVLHLALDEVRHDFRVGFRDEAVSFLLEQQLQLEVVLDDPVVDDGEALGHVHVRVSICIRRLSMGRPPGVADSQLPGQ